MAEQAYARAFRVLRQRILSGTLRAGERLAPERVLCQELGVSRITVRHALRLLQEHGLIVRQPGRGTFVQRSGAQKLPIVTHDFVGSVQRQAPDMTRRLLAWDTIAPPEFAAQSLGLVVSDTCTRVQRVDFLGSTPIGYDSAYTPHELARVFDEQLLVQVDFLPQWLARAHVSISHSTQSIEACPADASTAEVLATSKGTPVLRVIDICYGHEGYALAVFESFYHGEHVQLTSTIGKGAGHAVLAD